MRATITAREAAKRKGALFIHTSRGTLRVMQATPWGRNVGLFLEDGRFVTVDPKRELLTSKGVK
jgi:hypothetical protein